MRMKLFFLLNLIVNQTMFSMLHKHVKVHPERYYMRLLSEEKRSCALGSVWQVVCEQDEDVVAVVRLSIAFGSVVEFSFIGQYAEGFMRAIINCMLAKACEWHCYALRFVPDYLDPRKTRSLEGALYMCDFKRDEKSRLIKYSL